MKVEEFVENPHWADFLPEFRDQSKQRHLPTHEDCSLLNAEDVAFHLQVGGTLGSMPNYEMRKGQIDMLQGIVRAFNSREHLMVEAGTGVGKSLAYLIPSIVWAHTNDTPVVISTATRNLQSQLIGSDIPYALSVLGDQAKNFKVALLKGRNNYLCLRAVAEFFASGYWTMSEEEQAHMPHFIDWLKTTKDGDLDYYDGLPRSLLTCPGEECSSRRCPFYTRCFVYRARKLASEAHLIVANHSLVLAEATSSNGAILPAYSRLIIDEAHNLESIATDYLSYEFSLPALTRILNRLIRKGRGKSMHTSGVFANLERVLGRSSLRISPVGDKITLMLGDAASHITKILNSASEVIDLAELLLKPKKNEDLIRYRVVNKIRQFSVRGLFQDYDNDLWVEPHFINAQGRLENNIASLVTLLHELRDVLENSVADDELSPFAEIAVQLNAMSDSLISFANEMYFVCAGEKDTHAYWIEKVYVENRHSYLRMVAAPLSVAEDLKALLYGVKDSVILSSATLRVGNDFRYMASHLGCDFVDGRFKALTASSPFDYLQQCSVLALDSMPDPSIDQEGYIDALSNYLPRLFLKTNGRGLVLFTSYEMMQGVAESVRTKFNELGLTLLVQGENMSRESMTNALRLAGDASRVVLFGAQSFWEGVDVSGEALSCVVLTRLPFAMVGDPIVEARCEKIAREGGNAFRDYSLPEAAIKFRQGFGRLIRSKRDRGVVIVTDPRIVTKNYGATFRKSIPSSVHTIVEFDEVLDRVQSFFAS